MENFYFGILILRLEMVFNLIVYINLQTSYIRPINQFVSNKRTNKYVAYE